MDQLTRLPHHLARPSGLAAPFNSRGLSTPPARPLRSCGNLRHAWAAAIPPRHDPHAQTRGILRHARPSAPPRLPLPRACPPLPCPGSSEPGWTGWTGWMGWTGWPHWERPTRRLPPAVAKSCGNLRHARRIAFAPTHPPSPPISPLAITRGSQSRGLLFLPARTCGNLRHAWVVATPSPSPCARRRPFNPAIRHPHGSEYAIPTTGHRTMPAAPLLLCTAPAEARRARRLPP